MKIKKKILPVILALGTMVTGSTVILDSTVQAATKPVVQKNIQKVLDFNRSADKPLATAWGNKFYNKWIPNVSSAEKKEFVSYTDLGYFHLNAYLQEIKGQLSGKDIKMEKKIKRLDRAFSVSSVPDNIVVYRRSNESAFGLEKCTLIKDNKLNKQEFSKFKNKLLGKYQTDYTYMSTSILKDASESFSGRPILIRLKVPKGNHGAYLAPLSPSPWEMEMLLPRNTTYKVNGISYVKNGNSNYILVDASIIKAKFN